MKPVTLRILFFALSLIVALPSAHSLAQAPYEQTAPSTDDLISQAQDKLQRYQWRIPRLEDQLRRLDSEIAELGTALRQQQTRLDKLRPSVQQAREQFETTGRSLANSQAADSEARRHHAEFALFLAERKYNRAAFQLSEIQTVLSEKSEFRESRYELLQRNYQGVAWQQQVLASLLTDKAQQAQASRRVAQLDQF